MSNPCVLCGGKFMWLQHNLVTSNDINNRIHVDVFRCMGCGYLFIVDKTSKNPNKYNNTINKFDEEHTLQNQINMLYCNSCAEKVLTGIG